MTTHDSDIIVKLDDRVRLMSAVLAATSWAEQNQKRRPHGTHAHARATSKRLAPLRSHSAVLGMQKLLDEGAPLDVLFALAMLLRWPELTLDHLPRWCPVNWDDSLGDFYASADLTDWWYEERVPWHKSLVDVSRILEHVRLKPFFEPFFGEVKDNLEFIPNIAYPTDQEIGLHVDDSLVCIVPPRLAWGDSPPWPFDEDPIHVLRAAVTQYSQILVRDALNENRNQLVEVMQTPLPIGDQLRALYPTWEEQLISIFIAGIVAIYLQDHVSKAEADAYILMERKVRGMAVLPGVISVLRRYLSEHQAGRYQTFVDYLPLFPKQLRIAARIVAL